MSSVFCPYLQVSLCQGLLLGQSVVDQVSETTNDSSMLAAIWPGALSHVDLITYDTCTVTL